MHHSSRESLTHTHTHTHTQSSEVFKKHSAAMLTSDETSNSWCQQMNVMTHVNSNNKNNNLNRSYRYITTHVTP